MYEHMILREYIDEILCIVIVDVRTFLSFAVRYYLTNDKNTSNLFVNVKFISKQIVPINMLYDWFVLLSNRIVYTPRSFSLLLYSHHTSIDVIIDQELLFSLYEF